MARIAPELSSPFAKYPMTGQHWLDPSSTILGSPAFIPSEVNADMKEHYVYGRGELGKGYYHLTTRDSYGILYKQLQSSAPSNCCACDAASSKALGDHDEVRLLCYYRAIASVPNDSIAKQEGLAIARGQAQSVYHLTQNAQLVVGGIQLSTL